MRKVAAKYKQKFLLCKMMKRNGERRSLKDGVIYQPESEGWSLRKNRVKKTPFQLIEDPNDKKIPTVSSSTSSIVPPKKVTTVPKHKAPSSKVLISFSDVENGQDLLPVP